MTEQLPIAPGKITEQLTGLTFPEIVPGDQADNEQTALDALPALQEGLDSPIVLKVQSRSRLENDGN